MESDTPLSSGNTGGDGGNAPPSLCDDEGGGRGIVRQPLRTPPLGMSRSANDSSHDPVDLEEDEEEVVPPVELEIVPNNDAPLVSAEFQYRVELCARNLRQSWGQTQKVKKALWAFFVPNEPAKPGTDATTYRSGTLEVACIICHATKTGELHPEFPVSKDEEERRNEQDVDAWAGSICKDRQGRVAKHIFLYKPQDGNGTVKYHVNTYHSEELKAVRQLLRLIALNFL